MSPNRKELAVDIAFTSLITGAVALSLGFTPLEAALLFGCMLMVLFV